MPDSIKKLKDLFVKFPTVGPRTANRFAYYLIQQPKERIDELITAMQDLKSQIKFCSFCFQPFEDLTNSTLCEICKNPSREKTLLCIVEKESDLITIENTKRYKGLYFVLKGGADNLRIEELKERVKGFTEVIIATNPTTEGKATSVLIERALKEIPQSTAFKITHLAKGIPVGGELEYADEETLESAFEGRK